MSSTETTAIFSSEEVVIEGSVEHKAITALAVDRLGECMVTGGVDGVMTVWDFGKMTMDDHRPVQQLVPLPNHSINALSFSATSRSVLCVCSDAKARIFSNTNGTTYRLVEETVKGDQYIRTPENTRGHTHMLSSGEFHPTDASRFMTGSYDSTVRLWDLNAKKIGMDQNIPNINCFKCTDKRGICGGTGMYVTAASYSPDGAQVIAGCSDGSLQLFHEKYKYGKATQIARSAHPQSEVTDVHFFSDNVRVVSRGMDNTVSVWDTRNLKKEVSLQTFSEISTNRAFSGVDLWGDESLLVAGSSDGELVLMDLKGGSSAARKKFSTPALIKSLYHPYSKQMYLSSSDGNVWILYDRLRSTPLTGALLFCDKSGPSELKKLKTAVSRQVDDQVYAYDELVEGGKYRENKAGEIKQISEKSRERHLQNQQKQKSQSIELFAISEGKVGLTNLPELRDSEIAPNRSSDNQWISRAYRETQPEAVLDFSESTGAAESLLKKKKYCPRCGLKICTCGYMRTLEGMKNVE